MSRIAFVTGRLASEPLRTLLGPLAADVGFEFAVIEAPISVAALMTTPWLAKRVAAPTKIDRVILPGWCGGDLKLLEAAWGTIAERGPKDFRDLPEYFKRPKPTEHYGDFDIAIFAEINHADRLEPAALLGEALRLQREGADIVDLGSTPGQSWAGVGDAVRLLRDAGLRISIDTFDSTEAFAAARAGAEVVLSVNASNRQHAVDWGTAVVAIPDRLDEGWSDTLSETAAFLRANNVACWLDPILEPIGIGFAASLGRFLEARRQFPECRLFMGVGNLTELTEVDSAGVNALLTGFCQELAIDAVLTTEVIFWAQSAVRELDIARRLMKHAIDHGIPPKHVDDRLVIARGGGPCTDADDDIARLQRAVADRNFRIHVADGMLHAFNRDVAIAGPDAFELFQQLGVADPSHAFYLGWEMMKATIALQLGKRYVQDEALSWGFLTVEEKSHREKQRRTGHNSPASGQAEVERKPN